jgi:hypothetical protein
MRVTRPQRFVAQFVKALRHAWVQCTRGPASVPHRELCEQIEVGRPRVRGRSSIASSREGCPQEVEVTALGRLEHAFREEPAAMIADCFARSVRKATAANLLRKRIAPAATAALRLWRR